ncbi:hypothetical protein LguiA_016999 [Lonicera macranthoides]
MATGRSLAPYATMCIIFAMLVMMAISEAATHSPAPSAHSGHGAPAPSPHSRTGSQNGPSSVAVDVAPHFFISLLFAPLASILLSSLSLLF